MTANLWFAVIMIPTGALSEPSVLLPDPAASALVCEHFSALCSSASEHLTAVSCGHSFHKAVLFFSVELLRLVCSFHCFLLLLSILFKDMPLLFIKGGQNLSIPDPSFLLLMILPLIRLPHQCYSITHNAPRCQVFFLNFHNFLFIHKVSGDLYSFF